MTSQHYTFEVLVSDVTNMCVVLDAGLLADGLIKRGVSVTQVRKRLQTVAFLGPALALIILSRSKDPRIAVACMTCALGITSLGPPLIAF